MPHLHIETHKDAYINPLFLEPGSTGSGVIVPGRGPITVFLDPEFADGFEEGQFNPRLTYSAEPVLKDEYGSGFYDARKLAEETVGTRYTAKFYEQVLAQLFQEEIDIKQIATGVTTFTGEFYHDFGYLVLNS